MSAANRLKRENRTGQPKNKRALGILAVRRLKWGSGGGAGWSRRTELAHPSPAAQRAADEKREWRRRRRLAIDRHGYTIQ